MLIFRCVYVCAGGGGAASCRAGGQHGARPACPAPSSTRPPSAHELSPVPHIPCRTLPSPAPAPCSAARPHRQPWATNPRPACCQDCGAGPVVLPARVGHGGLQPAGGGGRHHCDPPVLQEPEVGGDGGAGARRELGGTGAAGAEGLRPSLLLEVSPPCQPSPRATMHSHPGPHHRPPACSTWWGARLSGRPAATLPRRPRRPSSRVLSRGRPSRSGHLLQQPERCWGRSVCT